jgi:hypothetical protein
MPLRSIPQAVSMNIVLDLIESRLGTRYSKQVLSQMEIAQLIIDETLLTYSKYFPLEAIQIIRMADRVDEGNPPGRTRVATGRYYLRTETAVMSVNRVVGGIDTRVGMASLNHKGIYRDGEAINSSRYFMSGLVDSKLVNDILGATTLNVTTKFEPPNKVEIIPRGPYEGIALVLHCVHPVTLHTIPLNMMDEFVNMAECDVLIAMKRMLKKFKTNPGVFGEVQLETEEMDAALENKKGILEKWTKGTMLRANKKRWYVG